MAVTLGIDDNEALQKVLGNKRIGLITNPTGINSRYESIIDILAKNYNLIKMLAPEHGIRGDLQAGDLLDSYTDEATGLPVISLYRKSKKLTPDMIEDVDCIVFDLPEVGSRFYTYLYTMAYVMEACKENGKQIIVIDRPNPMNCKDVEGNLLKESCKSFIGLYPIPQRYGLTIGECANLFNSEFNIGCDLTVLKMKNYSREMYFEDTKLPWILPSPNIPTIDSCFTFNTTCIFEGTNVSEGRGTTKPFSFIGAPYICADDLSKRMNDLKLEGVFFRPVYFTPFFSKHAKELCKGVEVCVVDRNIYKPVKTGLHLLYQIRNDYKNNFEFLPPYYDKGCPMIDYNTGDTYIREGVYSLEKVLEIYEKDTKTFIETKKKYELY